MWVGKKVFIINRQQTSFLPNHAHEEYSALILLPYCAVLPQKFFNVYRKVYFAIRRTIKRTFRVTLLIYYFANFMLICCKIWGGVMRPYVL